ncbi:MAG: WcaF family extracellular polysaccharide biosynthesis acetyltransferase [Phycisphaerae bacterium]|nr:WcaF family extracellular polysaccharide biosynthesis acetyltransferase [Phycisphaerae bacterium]
MTDPTQQPGGRVDLAAFSPGDFDRGAGALKEALWILVRTLFFELLPGRWYGLKRALLRAFGAKIGRGVVIKPGARVAFPWKLAVGDHCWIGEDAWLLNLAEIVLEDHVALAHRAFLTTGNHDYNSPTFELIVKPIRVCRGAWLTAGTYVGPGVTVGEHAVLGLGAVATKDLEPYGVYRGNPAQKVAVRRIRNGV